MKFNIRIMPRDSVLDAQGRTLEKTLRDMGYQQVSHIQVGKNIQVEVDSFDESEAQIEVRKMAENIFHNPLIEKFEIERIL